MVANIEELIAQFHSYPDYNQRYDGFFEEIDSCYDEAEEDRAEVLDNLSKLGELYNGWGLGSIFLGLENTDWECESPLPVFLSTVNREDVKGYFAGFDASKFDLVASHMGRFAYLDCSEDGLVSVARLASSVSYDMLERVFAILGRERVAEDEAHEILSKALGNYVDTDFEFVVGSIDNFDEEEYWDCGSQVPFYVISQAMDDHQRYLKKIITAYSDELRVSIMDGFFDTAMDLNGVEAAGIYAEVLADDAVIEKMKQDVRLKDNLVRSIKDNSILITRKDEPEKKIQYVEMLKDLYS